MPAGGNGCQQVAAGVDTVRRAFGTSCCPTGCSPPLLSSHAVLVPPRACMLFTSSLKLACCSRPLSSLHAALFLRLRHVRSCVHTSPSAILGFDDVTKDRDTGAGPSAAAMICLQGVRSNILSARRMLQSSAATMVCRQGVGFGWTMECGR
eukprot:scaffold167385_cov17-Tisochrysis_lutea.AAC.2